jgi:hypothetical protein
MEILYLARRRSSQSMRTRAASAMQAAADKRQYLQKEWMMKA